MYLGGKYLSKILERSISSRVVREGGVTQAWEMEIHEIPMEGGLVRVPRTHKRGNALMARG